MKDHFCEPALTLTVSRDPPHPLITALLWVMPSHRVTALNWQGNVWCCRDTGSFPCSTWGHSTLTTSSDHGVGETTIFGDSIPDNIHQCHRDRKSVARNGTADLQRAKSVLWRYLRGYHKVIGYCSDRGWWMPVTDRQEIFDKIPVHFRVHVSHQYGVGWILGQENRWNKLLLPPSVVLATNPMALLARLVECDCWYPGPVPAVIIISCLPKFLLYSQLETIFFFTSWPKQLPRLVLQCWLNKPVPIDGWRGLGSPWGFEHWWNAQY